MGHDTKNTERLGDMLKPHEQKLDILKEALDEVSQERAEKRKESAKELIRKALDLKSQMDKAKSAFEGQTKKWDKELGKVMNRLQNMASGRPLNDGEEDEEDGDGDDAADSAAE